MRITQDLLEKDYEYKVGAFKNNGESSSPIIRVKTAPKTPTNLKFTNPNEGEIILTWTDNATVEEGYEIWQRLVGSGGWSLLTNALPPNSTTFTYAGSDLYCASNYEYKLAAYVRNGDKVIYSEWYIYTIDSSGGDTSLALDSNNKAHISYGFVGGIGLKYATNRTGSCQIATLDQDMWVGGPLSIAMDSNNKVHVSYYNRGNEVIKYASNEYGTCQLFTVAIVGTSGPNLTGENSIAVDSNGKIHIAFEYCGNNEP